MSYEHFCRYFDTFKFKIVQRYYSKYSININIYLLIEQLDFNKFFHLTVLLGLCEGELVLKGIYITISN